MERRIEINGRAVVINETDDPHAATMTIDGTPIPLKYYEDFAGWAVTHTIYGHFSDLELLAEHMIISNPRLIIGHRTGHGGGGHAGGGHEGHGGGGP